jgi:hypothetical protein
MSKLEILNRLETETETIADVLDLINSLLQSLSPDISSWLYPLPSAAEERPDFLKRLKLEIQLEGELLIKHKLEELKIKGSVSKYNVVDDFLAHQGLLDPSTGKDKRRIHRSQSYVRKLKPWSSKCAWKENQEEINRNELLTLIHEKQQKTDFQLRFHQQENAVYKQVKQGNQIRQTESSESRDLRDSAESARFSSQEKLLKAEERRLSLIASKIHEAAENRINRFHRLNVRRRDLQSAMEHVN